MTSLKVFGHPTNIKDYEEMLYNVIQPRKLPNGQQNPSVEHNLLEIFFNFIESSGASEPIKNTFKTMRGYQEVDYISLDVQQLVLDLNTGQMLPIYIQQQNSGIIFEKIDDFYLIHTFQVQLKNELVVQNINGVEIDFPMFSYQIPNEDFRLQFTQSFVKLIQELCKVLVPESVTQTMKGGSKNTETREVVAAIGIFDYLIPQLLTENAIPVDNKIKIWYDDAVHWNSAKDPFRTSNILIFLQTITQYLVYKNISHYKEYYKMLNCILMCEFCQYTDQIDESLIFDSVHQTQKRLLQINQQDEFKTEFANVSLKIVETYKKLNNKWDDYCNQMKLSSQIGEIKQFDDNDTIIDQNKEITNYLEKMTEIEISMNPKIVNDLQISQQISPLPNLQEFQNQVLQSMNLYENEEHIFKNYIQIFQKCDKTEILTYFLKYRSKTQSFYLNCNDCLGLSRMLLVCAIFIQQFDKICCEQLQDFSNYQFEADFSFLDVILLPSKELFEIAKQLKLYVKGRNDVCKYPHSANRETIDQNSFQVKYALNNKDMQNQIQYILKKDQEYQNKTEQEYLNKKTQYQNLMNRANALDHDEFFFWKIQRMTHDKIHCEKCALEKQAYSIQMSIYQKLLPDNLNYQNAIIFEFNCPQPLQDIRKVLYYFYKNSNVVDIQKYEWKRMLEKYHNSSSMIQLFSGFKPFFESHYGGQLSISSAYSLECAIKNNPCNCQLQQYQQQSFQTLLKLNENFLNNFKITKMFIDTQKQENQVLSFVQNEGFQNKQKMQEFCLIRCQPQLQLLNIIRLLRSSIHSFDDIESVYMIMYTLHQTIDCTNFQGNSTNLLFDNKFVTAFCEECEKFVDRHQDNYGNCNSIYNIVQIINKLTVYGNVDTKQILIILSKIIQICYKWSQSIDSNQQTIKIIIASCIINCFDNKLYHQLLENHTEFILIALADIYEITIGFTQLEKYDYVYILSNSKIMSYITQSIQEEIRKNPEILTSIVKKYWSNNINSQITWQQMEQNKDIFYATIIHDQEQNFTQFNVRHGQLLINQQKIGKLPDYITKHQLFQQLFPKSQFRTVQREGSWVSKYDNETDIKFQSIKESLKVTFVQNRVSFELIPNNVLNEQVPFEQRSQFNLFYQQQQKMMYFKEKQVYKNILQSSYTLDTQKNKLHLRDDRQISFINNLNKKLKQIKNIFTYIEQQQYIQAYKVQIDSNISDDLIELQKIDLRFKIKENKLFSQEFDHYFIAQYQKGEVFIGLNNILVLQHTYDDNLKLFLVPQGKITIKTQNYHCQVNVDINYQNILKRNYLAITYDKTLNRFVAENSIIGTLFQAFLHFVTTSFYPDPLTNICGIEHAILILQQECLNQVENFSIPEVIVLNLFQKYYFTRKFYPPNLKTMIQTQFNEQLCLHSQNDMLGQIIDQIVLRSSQYEFLNINESNLNEYKKIGTNSDLGQLFSIKNNHFYTKYAQFSNKFIKTNNKKKIDTFQYNLNIQNHKIIVQLFENRQNKLQVKYSGNIFQIIEEQIRKLEIFDIFGDFSMIDGYLNTQNCINSLFQNFIKLYNLIREGKGFTEQIQNFISILVWNKVDINMILLFQTLYLQQQNLPQLKVHDQYQSINDDKFNNKQIYNILIKIIQNNEQSYLQKVSSQFDGEIPTIVRTQEQRDNYERYKQFINEKRQKYLEISNQEANQCFKLIQNAYPLQINQMNSILTECNKQFKIFALDDQTKEIIVSLTNNWFKNSQFWVEFGKIIEFCESKMYQPTHVLKNQKVESSSIIVQQLQKEDIILFDRANLQQKLYFETNFSQQISINQVKPQQKDFPLKSNLDDPIEISFIEELRESWDQFCKKDQQILSYNIPELLTKCDQHVKDFDKQIDNLTQKYQQIEQCSIIRTPILLWKDMQELLQIKTCLTPEMQQTIFDIMILFSEKQRIIRISNYLKLVQINQAKWKTYLDNELMYQNFSNWNPAEKIIWLMLQLELNCTIRPNQINIAHQMISPDGDTNQVTQLNMGEGKTQIIIPMLASLISQENVLCRVIVLPQLFRPNYITLKYKMGRLLNKAVLFSTCDRNNSFDNEYISQLSNFYRYIIDNNQIQITQPDFLQSFKLKVQEIFSTNQKQHKILFQLQNFIDRHSKDLMDESDELLSHKHQMIYTMGKQEHIYGGMDRWGTIEKVLHLLSKIVYDNKSLFQKQIEYSNEGKQPLQFSQIRIIDDSVFQIISNMLIDKILNGQTLIKLPLNFVSDDKQLVQQYILAQNENIFEEYQKLEEKYGDKFQVFKLLRGLLGHKLLLYSLQKRWRVNYGVDYKQKRKIAVPFKAKDVASDKTEFGHPEMTILLTLLSYYYSGLSLQQVSECLRKMQNEEDPNAVFDSIIFEIKEYIPIEFQQFSSINIQDSNSLQNKFYPLFKFNMQLVNYYLNFKVFPFETKQFPYKLSVAAQDLCIQKHYLVTGFSGTNETKLLLPCSIQQNILKQLDHTNGEMIYRILNNQNNEFHTLIQQNLTQNIILQSIESKCKVILDIGALMTEYSNKQTAQQWLKSVTDNLVRAAVYIDEQTDEIRVIDRKNRDQDFFLSQYSDNVASCLIYIDDFHTRGTDIKIPIGTKAIATLGNGVTKDKLMQGCMRMRQLGQGHSICFVASQEVQMQIVGMIGTETSILNIHVLRWACQNSFQFIKAGIVQWIANQIQFERKSLLYQKINNQCDNTPNTIFLDNEHYDYDSLYNAQILLLSVEKIAQIQLKLFCDRHLNGAHIDILSTIQEKANQFITVEALSCNYDEEQERELEQEVEVHKQIQKQIKFVEPKSHTFDSELIKFQKSEQFKLTPYPQFLEQYEIKHLIKGLICSNVFCSKDFLSVTTLNEIIRPIRWILLNQTQKQCALLTQFEVEHLKKQIPEAIIILYNPKIRAGCFGPQYLRFNNQINRNLSGLLQIFSGQIYFETKQEQTEYLEVSGFVPRPWSLEEQKMVDKGEVKSGWMATQNFIKNPSAFVKTLSVSIYDTYSQYSHVEKIVEYVKKPFE